LKTGRKSVAELEGLGEAVLEFKGAGLARGLGRGIPRFVNGRSGPWNFRALMQLYDGRVRDLPAESPYLALLPVTLLQKDGLPGVGSQLAGRGQIHLSGTVSDDDAAA
jgi:hypothetical protein